MEEIWKPVVGYEGIYSVSSFGRVRSDASGRGRRTGIIKKTCIGNHGYPCVNLHKEGKARGFNVHCLVAFAFIGPRPDGMQVDHRDSIRTNNNLSNLRYLDSQKNSSQPGSKNGFSKLTEKKVNRIRKHYMCGEITQTELAESNGVSQSLISLIVLNKSWRHVEACP